MLNRENAKLLWGFLGIVGLGVLLWAGSIYFNPAAREERSALRYWKDLEEQYKNDTYGGQTPEETLDLFVAALEAGDVELASRYFLPDEREKWGELLERAVFEKRVERMVKEARELELSGKNNKEAFYTIVDENNVVEVQVILKKNQNNVWKITEL